MQRRVPSLDIFVDTADGNRDEGPVIENEETLERTVTIGDRISGEFSFVRQMDFLSITEEDDEGGEGEEDESAEGYHGIRNMGLVERGGRGKGFNRDGELGFVEDELKRRREFDRSRKLGIAGKDGRRRDLDEKLGFDFEEEMERPISPPMHLATGLGIDKFDLYGNEIKFDDSPSFDDENCDGYYKRMLEDYPLHPLLLRNYAQFLEYKGDLHGAEDYYRRCTLVEPNDGEILVNYARLVMRLHRDKAKASNYFERAVRVSPEDSNVRAAYASFLWETNDDSEDDDDEEEEEVVEEQNHPGRREQYESNAADGQNPGSAQAETEDGETMYTNAKLLWEVHHDRDMALFYFKKAIQASPHDSNILAGYARFLWQTSDDDDDDDDDDDGSGQDQVLESSLS